MNLEHRIILGARVDATSYRDACDRIAGWAERGESRYVCVANVHGVMEGHDDPEFRRVLNQADLVTPDGMPLVWGLRRLGVEAARVYGPDLTEHLCARAARDGIPVGFHGGSPEALRRLLAAVRTRHPTINVAYAASPPFRDTTPEEDTAVANAVAASGARILFVGLGCPKQERWMAANRHRIPAVMVGVGAAFDFLSGAKRQAPRWMMRSGLEWAYRLGAEPRRLWKRYLRHNPRFVALFGAQLVRRDDRAEDDKPSSGRREDLTTKHLRQPS